MMWESGSRFSKKGFSRSVLTLFCGFFLLSCLLWLSGCARDNQVDDSINEKETVPEGKEEIATKVRGTVDECELTPIVVPPMAAVEPNYGQLDKETNLHFTGRVQQIDLESYRLVVTGNVSIPLSLNYDNLRCLTFVETKAELICPGFFEDYGTWAGAPLMDVLELAEIREGAFEIQLVSADGYSEIVPLMQVMLDENMIAYQFEGEPLPVLHGFPVRAVFPKLPGAKWVKWLVEIRVY